MKYNKRVKVERTNRYKLEDETYLNYLALIGAILTENSHLQQYFGLYNKEEQDKRIAEIDEIRKNGGKTELEKWYRESVEKDGTYYPREERKEQLKGNVYRAKKVEVTNLETGEVVEYVSIKQAGKAHGIEAQNMRNFFTHKKSNEIIIGNFKFKKVP